MRAWEPCPLALPPPRVVAWTARTRQKAAAVGSPGRPVIIEPHRIDGVLVRQPQGANPAQQTCLNLSRAVREAGCSYLSALPLLTRPPHVSMESMSPFS